MNDTKTQNSIFFDVKTETKTTVEFPLPCFLKQKSILEGIKILAINIDKKAVIICCDEKYPEINSCSSPNVFFRTDMVQISHDEFVHYFNLTVKQLKAIAEKLPIPTADETEN